MSYVFFTSKVDRRFPRMPKSAKVRALVKAVTMTPESEFIAPEAAASKGEAASTIALSVYFWRPWYAKLWWLAAAIFWIVAVVASWVFPSLGNILPANAIDYLALALHPFAIVPVLGFPAVWAWRRKTVFPWDPGNEADSAGENLEEELYGGESIGFGRRLRSTDLADPSDPASPFNPANSLYRLHHGEL